MARYYRVVLHIAVNTGADMITDAEVADHCERAAERWGGQFEPEHPLFPANIEVVGAGYKRLAHRPSTFHGESA